METLTPKAFRCAPFCKANASTPSVSLKLGVV